MSSQVKDNWDKAEIIGKWVVPAIVTALAAYGAFLWNVERTERQTAAAMTEIAVAILTGEKTDETEPLRRWAVSVLQAPSDPIPLSSDAADALLDADLPDARLPDWSLKDWYFAPSENPDVIQEPFRVDPPDFNYLPPGSDGE